MEVLSKHQRVSFHDPDGAVYSFPNRVLRRVTTQAATRLRIFLASSIAKALLQEGLLPTTRELSPEESGILSKESSTDELEQYIWFEHEKISFVSYAYEWVPEMLIDAAELTLTLAARLQDAGWDIKDATTTNILFIGTRPIFVDLCSIVPQHTDQPYWWPKGQFERHFILPLLAYIYRGISPATTHFSRSDGMEPSDLYKLLSKEKWFSPLVLRHCSVPLWMTSKQQVHQYSDYSKHDPRLCIYLQKWNINSLRKSLTTIKKKLPRPQSNWNAYTSKRQHYASGAISNKQQVVSKWLKKYTPQKVLDLGSNTGEFSTIAATIGSTVYAIEKDLDSARLSFINAKHLSLNCQVLLQDIGYPSPSMGWRQAEKISFNERANRCVDCVLALALMHHWLVTVAIPLDEIVNQLARWTKKLLIVEYVDPEDSMFLALCRQRNLDFSWLNQKLFKKILETAFTVIEEVDLEVDKRVVFLCERRA